VTALYKADELIQKRPTVKEAIDRYIHERLSQHGIKVDQISITDFRFSEAFTRAIEAKVTAVQEALKAENELQRVKFEAEQKVARAQAEAQSLKLQKEQITPQLIQLRQIEMMKEKWDGHFPNVMVGGNGIVPFMDISKVAQEGKR
jgi:regulator of protease activity HflC (stomatin/prohibitin superfamily)